ncbi:pilus assembly protein [Undibacterium sp. Ji22W]|uniref:pilus assembly protein n=1 Tax=Undibacterium sp. Ji22W TaxID=3413038 RepID=UPI003BF35B22
MTNMVVRALILAQVLLPLTSIAAISNLPPLVKANVPPNVFYTLDDSGSMMFEAMPEELTPTGNSSLDGSRVDMFTYCGSNCWVTRVFPSPADVYNVSGAGNYSTNNQAVVGFSDNITVARWRSPAVNKVYYDPNVRYDPWVDPASISTTNPYGSKLPNADPTAAKYNPVIVSGMSTATLNLTIEQSRTLHSNTWLTDAANNVTTTPTWTVNGASKTTFYPATYFQYNPSNLGTCTTSQLSCFSRVEIKLGTAFPAKASTRSDCALSTCTYAEEIINFANWFQYYRSRILSARAGSGRAFANQAATLRVGFGTINTTGTKVTNVSDDFAVTNKQNFLNTLYQRKVPAAGTPLRQAVDDIGQYFMNTTITGPWQTKYNLGFTTDQLSCRQNYNILMTDGYWNGNGAGSGRTGDWDAKNGTSKTSSEGAVYQYTAAPPYKDATTDTLADIAMYYWVNDLRPDWGQAKKNVPPSRDGTDPAFWQHLVQYTVGLGVSGTLDPVADLPALKAGTKNWPAATANDYQVDDLWHAALNSRGKYFNAGNPQEFSDALNSALNEIAARSGDAAAVATSKNTLDIGLKLYTSTYQTADWSGRLEQKSVDEITGNIKTPNDWDTDTKIPVPASRKIVTSNLTGTGGIDFSYSNLRSSDQGIFDTAAAAYAPAFTVSGSKVLDYLKGDKTLESKPFRARKVLLGDLVNSDPQYVKEGKDGGYIFLPSDIRGKGSYNQFLTTKKTRAATVYVGSNDGMLHAFDATDTSTGGSERFAYIPNAIIPGLPELAKPNYVHRFYVDGTPMIADAAIAADPTPWRSILVGTTGAGGRSVFAMDVTDPTSFDNTKVMWEYSATTRGADNDLGYTIGVAQIGVMRDGRWVAIFGNGFESTNQKAVLYIVDLKTGNVIRKLDTGVGSVSVPNGLATPKLLLNADSTIKAVYAGDRQGNMWKFDFVTTGTVPSLTTTPAVALSGLPLFTAVDSGRKQPITTQPQLYPHPDGGYMVVFGSGKIYEDTDAATTDKETLYGIWDKTTSSQVTQSQLVEQTLSASANFYSVSKNVVDWTSKRGWYITLKIKSGERIVNDPIIFEDQVIFTTLVPGNSADLCVIDALSTTLQISPVNGGALGYKSIDTNGDGIVNSSDTMVSGRQTSATFGTTIIRLGNRKVKIFQADARTGTVPTGGENRTLSDGIPTVRLWRQLIGRQ